MAVDKQTIIGKDNFQIYIENNNYNVKEVYKGIGNLFKDYDDQINKYFPNKIEYSKLKDYRGEFKSSKILSSLVKVDIPFENAFNIVFSVVTTLIEEIEEGQYDEGLSTHKIRKVVASTILNYPVGEVTDEEIEKWADKYVRKYGHDAQRIEVYYRNSERHIPVDFSFVKKILLEDIISELGIRNQAYRQEIPENQIKSISQEIIEFLNDCNMYKINYDTLKEFIIEMALQPPHPWFVTNKTARRICKYDLDILEKHYDKLCNAQKNNYYEDIYYTIYEALHHSCSAILSKYYEILGCKDLDVFYNLERITSKLNNREEENLLLENYSINNLPNDLKYMSIELQDFLNLLRSIKRKLVVGKSKLILEEKTISNIIKLCDIARKLNNNVDKEDVDNFLYSEWEEVDTIERNQFIKKIFETINGLKVSEFISACPNCFWIKRAMANTEKEIFTICIDDEMDFDQVIKFVSSRKAILNTEAVFIIVEYEGNKAYRHIMAKLDNEGFFIELIKKDDLQKIFKSNNKYGEVNEILKRGLYS